MIAEPDHRRASAAYYRTFLLRELPAALRTQREPPDVPVRFIGGARDPVIRWSEGVERIPGAGHFLPEEKPDAVIGHVTSFL
jgi:pimeloyl-ACP methyl ester carboxylesterase